MRSRPVFAVFLLIAFAPAAIAEEAHYYFFPHYLASHLSGNTRQSSYGTGTLVDFNTTFNVDGTEPTVEVDGFVRFRRYRVELGYTRAEVYGHAVFSEQVIYAGNRYGAGAHTHNNVEMDRERFMFGYDFLDGKVITLGPVVGAQHLRVETRIASYRYGGDVKQQSFLTPVVGGSLGLHPIRDLAIHVRVAGIYLDRTKVVDCSVTFEYLIAGRAGVGIGYSYYDINYADHTFEEFSQPDDHLELTQKGWIAGLILHL